MRLDLRLFFHGRSSQKNAQELDRCSAKDDQERFWKALFLI